MLLILHGFPQTYLSLCGMIACCRNARCFATFLRFGREGRANCLRIYKLLRRVAGAIILLGK